MNKMTKVTTLGGEVLGAIAAARQAREAWYSRDRLEVTNALASVVAVATGFVLAVRHLRASEDEQE
jgi:hypothetical protein